MQKYVFWKLNLNMKRQYFRYEEYINWLQTDDISFLRYERLNNDVTILTRCPGWKRFIVISLHGETTYGKNEESNCFNIQWAVKASFKLYFES